jgi:hypothetical protein
MLSSLSLALIALAFTLPAQADGSKEQQEENKCEGNYTMYTHPNKQCREQLRQEYEALIKAYLKFKAADLLTTKTTGESHESTR